MTRWDMPVFLKPEPFPEGDDMNSENCDHNDLDPRKATIQNVQGFLQAVELVVDGGAKRIDLTDKISVYKADNIVRIDIKL